MRALRLRVLVLVVVPWVEKEDRGLDFPQTLVRRVLDDAPEGSVVVRCRLQGGDQLEQELHAVILRGEAADRVEQVVLEELASPVGLPIADEVRPAATTGALPRSRERARTKAPPARPVGGSSRRSWGLLGRASRRSCTSFAGLDRPTAGQVWIGGVDITALDSRKLTDLRREELGFVFRFFNLVPVLTAEVDERHQGSRQPCSPALIRCQRTVQRL